MIEPKSFKEALQCILEYEANENRYCPKESVEANETRYYPKESIFDDMAEFFYKLRNAYIYYILKKYNDSDDYPYYMMHLLNFMANAKCIADYANAPNLREIIRFNVTEELSLIRSRSKGYEHKCHYDAITNLIKSVLEIFNHIDEAEKKEKKCTNCNCEGKQ